MNGRHRSTGIFHRLRRRGAGQFFAHHQTSRIGDGNIGLQPRLGEAALRQALLQTAARLSATPFIAIGAMASTRACSAASNTAPLGRLRFELIVNLVLVMALRQRIGIARAAHDRHFAAPRLREGREGALEPRRAGARAERHFQSGSADKARTAVRTARLKGPTIFRLHVTNTLAALSAGPPEAALVEFGTLRALKLVALLRKVRRKAKRDRGRSRHFSAQVITVRGLITVERSPLMKALRVMSATRTMAPILFFSPAKWHRMEPWREDLSTSHRGSNSWRGDDAPAVHLP